MAAFRTSRSSRTPKSGPRSAPSAAAPRATADESTAPPATEATTAYLSYDDTQLYVAFVCQASAVSQVRAHMSKRESVAASADSTASFPAITPLIIVRLMRICSEVRKEMDPVPGDTCGFGFSVVNSETGFGALSLDHYVIRYVCSNGAVMRGPDQRGRPGVHYGRSRGALRGMLESALGQLDGLFPRVEARLAGSTRRAAGEALVRAGEGLKVLVGARAARDALEPVDASSSLYELFNEVTAFAKTLPLEQRIAVESLAGDLLGEGGPQEVPPPGLSRR